MCELLSRIFVRKALKKGLCKTLRCLYMYKVYRNGEEIQSPFDFV